MLAIGVAILLLAIAYIALIALRKRYNDPRFIPTQYLRNRWRRWQPPTLRKAKYSSRLQEDDSVPTFHLGRSNRTSSYPTDSERAGTFGRSAEILTQAQNGGGGVDRNMSLRSVLTLPAYSKAAGENEQILGREGERGGIDVVVENPETAAEEEERRDEEMESLYQIRRQRRQEIADREDRRQRRREARERGDVVTLRALRQESALRAQQREISGAAAMIAEHQSRSRERRVSSVSYGDLGIARHDGTRIRAGSASSDRQPLMDSAASISGQTMQPALLRDGLSIHSRGRSTSSLMSGVSSEISDSELEAPPFGRAGSDFEVATLNSRYSRNMSLSGTPVGHRSRASSAAHRPSIDTTNVSTRSMPLANPPAYDGAGFEEAPPYVSPATERAAAAGLQRLPQIVTESPTGAPMLPAIGRLPSIRIAEATPIEPRGAEAFPAFH